MTTQDQLFLAVALVGIAVAASLGSLAYRMVMPPPTIDLEAINLFLDDRQETLVRAQKLWFGGPEGMSLRGSTLIQTGRPYKLVARSLDGALWTHSVATHCRVADGIVPIMQHVNGGWHPIHY